MGFVSACQPDGISFSGIRGFLVNDETLSVRWMIAEFWRTCRACVQFESSVNPCLIVNHIGIWEMAGTLAGWMNLRAIIHNITTIILTAFFTRFLSYGNLRQTRHSQHNRPFILSHFKANLVQPPSNNMCCPPALHLLSQCTALTSFPCRGITFNWALFPVKRKYTILHTR